MIYQFPATKRHPELLKSLTAYLSKFDFDSGLRLLCAAAERAGRGDLYERWTLKKGDRMANQPRLASAWVVGKLGPRRNGMNDSVAWYEAQIPGQDHLRFIVRADGTREVLSQPYELTFETMVELVAWCQARGIRADVDTHAGHFPGRTLAIHLESDPAVKEPK